MIKTWPMVQFNQISNKQLWSSSSAEQGNGLHGQ